MINKESLTCIGYISRPYSYNGEVHIKLERKIVPLQQDDFLFIKIQGHYIPHKILNVKGKESEPVLQLEFVTTYDLAQEICSSKVFTDKEALPQESELSFIGFEIMDKHLGIIGKVEDVLEMPKQVLLTVSYNDELKYIPLAEDFIDYISAENKEIWLTLPQGLLDI